MLLSNNSYDNHGIYDNIVLPDITILKISLRYRLSWHFDIMINDNIVILPNSNTNCNYLANTSAIVSVNLAASLGKSTGV